MQQNVDYGTGLGFKGSSLNECNRLFTAADFRFAFYSGQSRDVGIASPAVCIRRADATSKGSAMRLSVLCKSYGHDIPTASFGFVEALVRDLEQLGAR
jgi:hypothetical protein